MKKANAPQPAAENRPAILAVIFTSREKENLQRAAAFMQTAGQPVGLIVEGRSESGSTEVDDLPAGMVPMEHGAGRGRSVKAAARSARRRGMTHIVTLDADRLPSNDQMAVLVSAAAAHSDAVVVGRQERNPGAGTVWDRFLGFGWLKNFFFRLQTGIRLTDAASRLRCYPLVIFERLRLHANRNAFDTEVLTKAAWAGLEIKEVDIRLPEPATTRRTPFWQSVRSGLGVLAMNIHLTMRSITPLPHRKIVSAGDRPGETITVFRPLRSIRALLTENVTPVQLAAAAGMGVWIGALPLIGLHTITILFVSSYFRLNKVATLAANQLGIPPVMPALCIEVGYFMRHGEFLTEMSLETLGYQALERLWEWFLGSLVVGPALAVLVGGLVFVAASLINRGIRGGKRHVTMK